MLRILSRPHFNAWKALLASVVAALLLMVLPSLVTMAQNGPVTGPAMQLIEKVPGVSPVLQALGAEAEAYTEERRWYFPSLRQTSGMGCQEAKDSIYDWTWVSTNGTCRYVDTNHLYINNVGGYYIACHASKKKVGSWYYRYWETLLFCYR